MLASVDTNAEIVEIFENVDFYAILLSIIDVAETQIWSA